MSGREEQDIPRLLGLTGTGAMIVVGVFWLATCTLAAFSGGPLIDTPFGGATLGAVLLAAVLLVLPGRYPLSGLRTGAVIGSILLSNAVIDLQLEPHGSYGYGTWQLGADTFLMFGLALRGRVIWAWIGMAIMIGIAVGWSIVADGSPWDGLGLVYRHIGTLIPGTLLAVGLRSTGRNIIAFREAEARRVRDESRRAAVERQRAEDIGDVRRLALPALERLIAAEGLVTPQERRDHRAIEGELRDRIRGRRLAAEPVTAVVREARQRGVDVALMDDLTGEAPSEGWLAVARAWLAARLAEVGDAGAVTARLTRDDRGAILTVASPGAMKAATFRMLGSSPNAPARSHASMRSR